MTPLIAILRNRQKHYSNENNKLIFANKTKADIILKDELEEMLGDNFINILSKEKSNEYAYGHIDAEFLNKHIDKKTKNFMFVDLKK